MLESEEQGVSDYCGLCNGHLNGPMCHKNLIEAEDEVEALTVKIKKLEAALTECKRQRDFVVGLIGNHNEIAYWDTQIKRIIER